MKIIGIDPAPGKNSTVFDGKDFHSFTSVELGKYLENLKKEKHVLICWDSPLTGPPLDQTFANNENRELTFRKVEIYYEKLLREIDGVNVRGYGGCPHWTISKHLLGLPIMGKYDQTDTPFKLVFDIEEIKPEGHYITETHPAVAMYVLLKNQTVEMNYIYKGGSAEENKKNLHLLKEKVFELLNLNSTFDHNIILSDDHFDAFLCYILAFKWYEKDEILKVGHIGDKDKGSFLIPNFEKERSEWFKI